MDSLIGMFVVQLDWFRRAGGEMYIATISKVNLIAVSAVKFWVCIIMQFKVGIVAN